MPLFGFHPTFIFKETAYDDDDSLESDRWECVMEDAFDRPEYEDIAIVQGEDYRIQQLLWDGIDGRTSRKSRYFKVEDEQGNKALLKEYEREMERSSELESLMISNDSGDAQDISDPFHEIEATTSANERKPIKIYRNEKRQAPSLSGFADSLILEIQRATLFSLRASTTIHHGVRKSA